MPNPTISPTPWAPGVSYTVTDSDELRVDVRLSDLDDSPAEIELTPPPGVTIRVLRNPVGWTTSGSDIMTGGVWAPAPVPLGPWTLTVSPGSPSALSVSNPSGTDPQGILRLVVTGLAGAGITIGPGGGDLSIDRLVADPSIMNAQVTSGSPVRELDAVTLGATLSSTSASNPGPVLPLTAAPAVVGQWQPAPANAVALGDFVPIGATATFTAPAVYSEASLDFELTAGLDLAGDGTVSAGDPTTVEVLAVPVLTVTHRMVLVLDRSGSMGSGLGGGGSKWDATVQAAHAWIDLFRALRPGAGHQAGILTFEHDSCTWVAAPASNITLRNPTTANPAAGLTALSTFGDVTSLSLGTVKTCTPIGDAVVKAFEALGGGDLTGAKGSIVLLTDGYENAGTTTIAAAAPPGAPSVVPLATRLAALPGQVVTLVGDRIFTLAVGASVDEDRLNALPGGNAFYRLTEKVTDILPGFVQMLGEVLEAELATPVAVADDPDVPDHGVYFDVPSAEQRVVFLVPWGAFTDELRVGWRPAGSAGSFTLVSSADAAVAVAEQRGGHGITAVDLAVLAGNPVPGTQWRVQHVVGGIPQPLTSDDVLAVRDLHTRAAIAFDKRQYFIGDQIRLTCTIRSGGVPVTGAVVDVDLAKPGEGLGTFLATNVGKLPRPDGTNVRTRAGSHVATHGTAGGQGPDPLQGKGLMFDALLRAAEIDGLPVLVPPDLTLLDDGAHGDGSPDDGVYSNVFGTTDKEGTYTFRFRVSGQLPDGSRFSRLFIRSTWVGVRPDPVATTVAWQLLGVTGAGLQQAVLRIRPQTAGGELLGPFRTAVITFALWDAELDGDLVDRLDGSYEQRITYRPSARPIIVPTIYDEPLRPTGPTIEGNDRSGCLFSWLRPLRALLRWLRRLLRRLFG